MDSGYYAAFTGLLARQQALDATANNLANTNTTGFRAEREFFSDVLGGPDAFGSQLNTAVNDYGVLGGNQIDLSQGQMVSTGNPLDLALEGQGFFAVEDPQGNTQYTRDGSFMRSTKGVLTTSLGERVLDAKGKPITIPTGPVTIAADGTVSVNGGATGKIGIFTFATGTPLVPEGLNRYQTPPKTATVTTAAVVHQGKLESSNQNVVQGTLQLILVQRQAEMMMKALSVFSNDLDQQASQDLPRI
ncbi:MAG TPA: flagellar hook basal-body protein [Acidobacteriaceae bacterium]|nr:flagellar hook basal-body protein [Terriglobia bacterium]HVC91215.1 flagellar hook basal-body protein [Acidobacteriaceae bacterium]